MFQPSERVFDAIEVAARAHRGQVRKGTGIPYLVHPLGVARLLIEAGCDEDLVIAGVLHDTVEDSDLTADEIRERFGERVADLVTGLSEPDKSDTWENRKKHTLEYLREAPKDVVLASCADKLDNLRSIQEDLERQGEELWGRFKRGREQQGWYYRGLAEVISRRLGRSVPLAAEFSQRVEEVFGAA